MADDIKYIGFNIDRNEYGRPLKWDDFEAKYFGPIVNLIREHSLPDIMDCWHAWHQGAYFGGPADLVDRIDGVLEAAPGVGMTVYYDFPLQFYLDSQIRPELYPRT